MASLKIYVNEGSPFDGKKTNVVVNDLDQDQVKKLLPIVHELVLGIPVPAVPAPIIHASLFPTDVNILQMLIERTYVASYLARSTSPNKILLIKFVRSITTFSLKEAKDLVDRCESSAQIYRPTAA
jgi:hypothetical protein